MKKNPFFWMLTAALVCGLSLTVTSCSDDDNDDNNNKPVSNETVIGGDITDDEIVLATILGNWCDFDASADLVHGIIDKTYEPTEGEQTDPANAFVRGVVVGNLEGADAYAQSTLGSLGFDINEAEGFQWSNPAIGTISYEHGSGNELGIIRMQIKQIPHLTTLRLLANAEVNAGEEPYYSRGDIVKNTTDNCFYLCVSDHSYGQKSVWISFDSEAASVKDQNTNTSYWVGFGSDLYYNKPQASYTSLATWLANYVLNDNGYREVINKLSGVGASDAEVNQLVPSSTQLRKRLVEGLTYNARTALFEAWETVGGEGDSRITNFDYTVLSEKKNQSQVRVYQPTGLLFGYSMRWSMKTVDHWQPYVLLVQENNIGEFRSTIKNIASQTTLSKSNFTWQELTDKPILASQEFSNASYRVCVAALHWTHNVFSLKENASMLYYGLLDFTKEKKDAAANDWLRSNITSHEVTYKDAGKKNKAFKSVAIARYPADKEI